MKENKFTIRRLGESKEQKVECRLIFAANKTISRITRAASYPISTIELPSYIIRNTAPA
jgi:transcriptional regulator with AAA-type ATPase domain